MDKRRLEAECRSYAWYLARQVPSGYVIAKYLDFHRTAAAASALKGDRFDRFLVEASARGPFWARLADSYASRFRKSSALRKKLVLTLALLECVPPAFEKLDATPAGGPLGAIVRLGWGAAAYVGTVVLSMVAFLPVRAVLALSPRSREVEVWEH
jgi:hypothetical protein